MTGSRPSAIRLTDEQRLDWLRLIRSETVGPRTFRKLVNHFGGAGAALKGLPDLARKRGLPPPRIATREEAEREWEACRRMGISLPAMGEADYPAALAAIPDAPPLLLVRGRAEALHAPCVAIVGSRNASAAGMKLAQLFAGDLGRAGFTVVSGLARGIDASAHAASLGTGTVAVLAGGHDRLYPPDHERLLAALLEKGAAVSEMPMGWEPRGRDFPRRNRIISGLSLGVLLVEAAARSGSLITARFALEQGREVFAVPGFPLDPRAEGPNLLLRQGATLATAASDVVDVLQPLLERSPGDEQIVREPPWPSDEEPLWDEIDFFGEPARTLAGSPPRPPAARAGAAPPPIAVGRAPPLVQLEALVGMAPVSPDDLARASGLPARDVAVALFEMENRGLLMRHAGGLVSRRVS